MHSMKGLPYHASLHTARAVLFGACYCRRLEGDKGGYIPYRDSKLTRLLQPSLGGNAKITIICTVTGALLSSDETHNTLKFANRAKRMKNHAAINEVSNEKVGILVDAVQELIESGEEPICPPPRFCRLAYYFLRSVSFFALFTPWYSFFRLCPFVSGLLPDIAASRGASAR